MAGAVCYVKDAGYLRYANVGTKAQNGYKVGSGAG